MTKPLLAISERQVCPFFLSTSWGIFRESLNFSTRFSFLKPHLTKSESKFPPKVESNLPSFVKATWGHHEKFFISLSFSFDETSSCHIWEQVCPFFLSTSWGILRESLNFSTRFSFLKPHLTKSESKFPPKNESNLPSFVKATRDHEKSFISLVFFFAPRLQEYWFFVFKRNSQLKRFFSTNMKEELFFNINIWRGQLKMRTFEVFRNGTKQVASMKNGKRRNLPFKNKKMRRTSFSELISFTQ